MNDEPQNLFPDTATRTQSEAYVRPPRTEGLAAIEAALRHAKPGEAIPIPNDIDIRSILVERGKVHGNFTDDAQLSQRLKSALREGLNWSKLSDVQTEALELIATKLARILSGDPDHKDHWADIQGYARLVEERL